MQDELQDVIGMSEILYSSNLHYQLWGKTNPYKALLCHMIDVGCCAQVYLESRALSAVTDFLTKQWSCSVQEAVKFASYLIALHDIGKATPQFQMQDEEQLKRLKGTGLNAFLPNGKLKYVRHEFLSSSIVKRIWKEWCQDRCLIDAYSCVLSLHHQRVDESDKKKPAVHEGWKILQNELESEIAGLFMPEKILLAPMDLDPVCILLSGILVLCDWVASSGPFDLLPEMTDKYYSVSYEKAREVLNQYGLMTDHPLLGVDSFCGIWPQIKEPRDIQKKVEDLDLSAPLTIIEAPMGEGKTEAALYHAVRAFQHMGKHGIYVALPTQATSNQMYGRFVSMMETINGGNTRLLHGTAFLMKEGLESIQSEDAREAEKWLGSSRMGLLDENGVGTVDQAMGSVLLARFSILRLLGLSNKVLIIDELHAYDAYMSEIIGLLLRWCKSLSVPVILLSATLQNSQRLKYLSCYMPQNEPVVLKDNYPLITQVTNNGSLIQTESGASMQTDYLFVPVRFGCKEDKIVRYAIEKIKRGGCYCILVNTVKRAQRIYDELERIKEPDVEILLFHAHFTMERRESIELECFSKFGKGTETNRPARSVLVATQVVEQSLDIDFDGMISELAPVDLLLQRAGRVHRHRNRARPEGLEKPVVHVVLPEPDATNDLEKRYDSSGYVYAPFLLYNTEKLLEKGRTVRVPLDVRSVIAYVYENVSEENMQSWLERSFSQQLMAANADHVAFPPPASDYFFPAQAHSEFEDLNIDDGFDPSSRAATRLGEPTFRISFTDKNRLESIKQGKMTKELQRDILLSSVSLRLTPDIGAGLKSGEICQIRKGPLWGCYVTDEDSVLIGNKKLMNDPELGVYWEGLK